jgi:hypothetical protein
MTNGPLSYLDNYAEGRVYNATGCLSVPLRMVRARTEIQQAELAAAMAREMMAQQTSTATYSHQAALLQAQMMRHRMDMEMAQRNALMYGAGFYQTKSIYADAAPVDLGPWPWPKADPVATARQVRKFRLRRVKLAALAGATTAVLITLAVGVIFG